MGGQVVHALGDLGDLVFGGAEVLFVACVLVAAASLVSSQSSLGLSLRASTMSRVSAPPKMMQPSVSRGSLPRRALDDDASDLFADSKADDDSLFAILREPLRPPSEWVPVDVSGSDWLGQATDDDLLEENTPTESQEEILKEYMRHEKDFGSPEYQIAKITQSVY